MEKTRKFSLERGEEKTLAMQDHWKDLSSAQQKEFLDLLRALIEKNYINGLRAGKIEDTRGWIVPVKMKDTVS